MPHFHHENCCHATVSGYDSIHCPQKCHQRHGHSDSMSNRLKLNQVFGTT